MPRTAEKKKKPSHPLPPTTPHTHTYSLRNVAASNLLTRWRHGVELGNLASSSSSNTALRNAAIFAVKNIMLSVNAPSQPTKNEDLVSSLNCDEKTEEEITETFLRNGVVYHPTPVFSEDDVSKLKVRGKWKQN